MIPPAPEERYNINEAVPPRRESRVEPSKDVMDPYHNSIVVGDFL